MALLFDVKPGYQFSSSERVTYSKLNLLGTPKISLEGTVGSSEITDGAIITSKLSDGIDVNSKINDHNLALTKLASGTHGQVLYYNDAGDLVTLPPGTSGYFLQTKGSGNDPTWAAQAGVSSLPISALATDGANKLISTDSSGNIQWETKTTGSFGGIALMWDQKVTNTVGGTSSVTDLTRDLNQSSDPSGFLADFDASAGTWELDPGTYFIEAKAPGHPNGGNFICWVENTSDASIAVNGSSVHHGSDKNSENQWSFASGVVEITGTSAKAFALKQQSQSAIAGGLGGASNISGHDEVYSSVKITKLA